MISYLVEHVTRKGGGWRGNRKKGREGKGKEESQRKDEGDEEVRRKRRGEVVAGGEKGGCGDGKRGKRGNWGVGRWGGDLRRSSKKERNIKDFLRISYS